MSRLNNNEMKAILSVELAFYWVKIQCDYFYNLTILYSTAYEYDENINKGIRKTISVIITT